MNNSLNLQEINQEQALDLTKFFIRTKQNIFIFGRKGVGKSIISLQAAKELNYKVNYINLSVIDRSDLCGFPLLFDEGDVVKFKSPYFLPPLKENEVPDSIILFDEVDKCSPEVTAPLLEILQFRKINGKPINAAACVLTGNLLNEGAYSNLISTALLDRGAKYILQFDFNQWLDWAKINNVHDLILGFLKSNPEFACGSEKETSYASPSPRGWTLASEALIKAKDLKIVNIETVSQIVSGFVGIEAGLRFKIWYEHYRKFEPFIHSLIESGTMILNFEELSPTEKLVFIVSMCHSVKQKVLSGISKSKNKFYYLENLCQFLTKNKVDSEAQVIGFYNSFSFDFITKHKLYTCKIFFDHFTKLNENIKIK